MPYKKEPTIIKSKQDFLKWLNDIIQSEKQNCTLIVGGGQTLDKQGNIVCLNYFFYNNVDITIRQENVECWIDGIKS